MNQSRVETVRWCFRVWCCSCLRAVFVNDNFLVSSFTLLLIINLFIYVTYWWNFRFTLSSCVNLYSDCWKYTVNFVVSVRVKSWTNVPFIGCDFHEVLNVILVKDISWQGNAGNITIILNLDVIIISPDKCCQ